MNAAVVLEIIESALRLAKKYGATRAAVLAAVEAHWPEVADRDDVDAAIKAGLARTEAP